MKNDVPIYYDMTGQEVKIGDVVFGEPCKYGRNECVFGVVYDIKKARSNDDYSRVYIRYKYTHDRIETGIIINPFIVLPDEYVSRIMIENRDLIP